MARHDKTVCSQHLGPCHSSLFVIASWHWPQFMMIAIMTHCSTRSDETYETTLDRNWDSECYDLPIPGHAMGCNDLSTGCHRSTPFQPKQDIPGFGVAHLVSFLSVCRVQGGWPDHGNGFCWVTSQCDANRMEVLTKWALQIHPSQRRMPDYEVTEKDADGWRNHAADCSKKIQWRSYMPIAYVFPCRKNPMYSHVLMCERKICRRQETFPNKAFFAPPAASCCAACAAANLCILQCSNIVGRCGQWTAKCWGKDFRRFSAVSLAIMMLDVCRCSQFDTSRLNNKARCGNERTLSLAFLDLEFDATFMQLFTVLYINEFEHLVWDIQLSAATPASQPCPDKEDWNAQCPTNVYQTTKEVKTTDSCINQNRSARQDSEMEKPGFHEKTMRRLCTM